MSPGVWRPLVLALLFCAPARAQEGAEDPQKVEKNRQARALYAEGVKQYNLQNYDQAIAAFKQSYLLSENPPLLYNIAQAYRQKGPPGCASALGFYQGYLR